MVARRAEDAPFTVALDEASEHDIQLSEGRAASLKRADYLAISVPIGDTSIDVDHKKITE